MSKPAPPKPSFLNTLLWALFIFTGFNLLFNRPQEKPLPTADLYRVMREQNAARMDVSILRTRARYDQEVDAQLKAKKLTPEQAEAKKIESAILAADAQFKAGINSGDTSRIRDAYYTLEPLQRHLLDKPQWSGTTYQVTDVTANPKFGWREWTGQNLYNRVTTALSERNKTDLVWGFIPGYQLIDMLVAATGRVPGFSYAFAAFLLALLVRGVIFKLALKQIMYGRKMSQLTPLTKDIKEKYKDDQVTQNQKVMELYKEYGVNPFAGCLPALVQMPLFFAIYQCMLHYQFEFQKGHFAWINEATSKSTNGFVAANLGQQDTILMVIYGITMIITTLLTPISDPSQAKQQRLMGIAISVIFVASMFTGAFPVVSAFVLYWTFTNLLATAQSLWAYRLPLPPLQKVNAAGGGVFPTGGIGGAAGGRWAKMMEQMQAAAEEQQRRQGGANGNGNGNGNGTSSSNGTTKSSPQTFVGTGERKTGTPAKHKPKRKK